MLSHYGWLMLHGEVEDPATEKHGGDVYFHKDDIVDGESLYPGDIVSFYLYSDEQGLGAEMCQVEQKAASRPRMNAGAKEFIPAGCPSIQVLPEKVDMAHVADVFLRLSYAFSDSSDDESEDEDELGYEAKRAPSSEGSTYGGATSDSEDEALFEESSDSETEPCSEVQWRPPPGLSLPAIGFSAPPGILPPGLEDIDER